MVPMEDLFSAMSSLQAVDKTSYNTYWKLINHFRLISQWALSEKYYAKKKEHIMEEMLNNLNVCLVFLMNV